MSQIFRFCCKCVRVSLIDQEKGCCFCGGKFIVSSLKDDLNEQIIQSLSNKCKLSELRQILADSGSREFDNLFKALYDNITKPETSKEDIITVFMALQEQNYVLANSLTNLVKKWPTNLNSAQVTTNGDQPPSGILYVIKD